MCGHWTTGVVIELLCGYWTNKKENWAVLENQIKNGACASDVG